MKNKLLTLSDLYSYFSDQNTDVSFSSEEEKTTIVIHEDFQFALDNSDNGLLKAHLKACHILKNRNNSYISVDAMEKAIPTFYNKPILGFIFQLSDGSYDFAGHEMVIDEDEIEYEEVPVGVIPESCNAQLVYDEELEKTYLEVDGYIYENYSKAADILREKNISKVSVEIAVDDLTYSAKEKMLVINRFHFNGVTILGKDRKTEQPIKEGMEGSSISLLDFGDQRNSYFSSTERYEKMIKMLEEIKEKVANLNINKADTEGGLRSMKFNELLEKYNKKAEEIDFKYEDMSEEDLEKKFEEMYGEKDLKKYSIEADGKTYTFEICLEDKIRKLESLVNNAYADADDTYYCVRAYDSYVVMIDCRTDKAYKQQYSCGDDVFTLTGDREEVRANYLTRSEEKALEEMRDNYSSISTKLRAYEEKEIEDRKHAIIEDEAYEVIKENDEFVALTENMKDYSVEEIESKCNDLLKQFARENRTFSLQNGTHRKIRVKAKQTEETPYGSLFSEE